MVLYIKKKKNYWFVLAFGIFGILICLIICFFFFFSDIVFFIDVIASLTKWAGRDLNVICYISLFY